jgi:tryptophan-rich sensory protein
MKRFRKFVASLAVCFGAGAVGGLFTATSLNSWYPQLNRPEFAPPNWVFAPVWNILYLLMAGSLYFVWSGDGQKTKRLALMAFAFQLFLNMAWSAVFFGLRSPAGGFFVILVLIAAIVWNIFLFGRISRKSALLLLPYLCWVGFAGYLNYGYWILNR